MHIRYYLSSIYKCAKLARNLWTRPHSSISSLIRVHSNCFQEVDLNICSTHNNQTFSAQKDIGKVIMANSTTGKLTHCLLVWSAHNLCKQIGPRSGQTKCWACSGSIWLTLRWYSRGVDFENSQQMTKSMKIS